MLRLGGAWVGVRTNVGAGVRTCARSGQPQGPRPFRSCPSPVVCAGSWSTWDQPTTRRSWRPCWRPVGRRSPPGRARGCWTWSPWNRHRDTPIWPGPRWSPSTPGCCGRSCTAPTSVWAWVRRLGVTGPLSRWFWRVWSSRPPRPRSPGCWVTWAWRPSPCGPCSAPWPVLRSGATARASQTPCSSTSPTPPVWPCACRRHHALFRGREGG